MSEIRFDEQVVLVTGAGREPVAPEVLAERWLEIEGVEAAA